MSKELNVWYIHIHEPWYRIDRKLANVCRKIQWSFQRITRGFCDYDVFDLDQHYCRYIRDTINHLRENCHGFPSRYTEGEWDSILYDLSNYFDIAQSEIENKYEEEFISQYDIYDILNNDITNIEHVDEIKDKYFEEEKRIHEYRQENLKKGLELLAENFNDLWD